MLAGESFYRALDARLWSCANISENPGCPPDRVALDAVSSSGIIRIDRKCGYLSVGFPLQNVLDDSVEGCVIPEIAAAYMVEKSNIPCSGPNEALLA
jgi:hypothetical protein